MKLLVENGLAGGMIDWFGKDIMMLPVDDNHFSLNIDVRVSGPFLGWIISLGEGVKIVGPNEVIEQMKREIIRLAKQYY